ncbi:hypothetical protein Tco_0240574 [Tanacetum coccineum]
MPEEIGVGEFSPSYYISQLGNSLIISGSFNFRDFCFIYAWTLEVDGGYVTSYRLLFTIPYSANNALKLLGFKQGVIMYDDMTYLLLVEMVVKKFSFDPTNKLNLSVNLPSLESQLDITDDEDVKFFVDCASSSTGEGKPHLNVGKTRRT